MKYTEEIVKEIVKWRANTDTPITEICSKVGIHHDTYYDWIKTKPEFSEAIKQADKQRLKTMKFEARKALFKRIQGYDRDEVKEEYGKDEKGEETLVKRTVITKHYQASDTLIMYALNNTDPENFKHKEHVDHTTQGEKMFDFSGMSTEELEKRAKAVKQLEDEQSEKKEN